MDTPTTQEEWESRMDLLFFSGWCARVRLLDMDSVYCEHGEYLDDCLRCLSDGDVVVEAELSLVKAARGPWVAEYDSCDCGDGYGCSHGSWVSCFTLGDPWSDETVDFTPVDYHYRYTEIAELSHGTAEFMTRSRGLVERLVEEVKRLRAEVIP